MEQTRTEDTSGDPAREPGSSNHEQGNSACSNRLSHELEVFVARSGTPATGANPIIDEINNVRIIYLESHARHFGKGSAMVREESSWLGKKTSQIIIP